MVETTEDVVQLAPCLVMVLVLVCLKEATTEIGLNGLIFITDGKGLPFLHMKAGGSVCPPSHFSIDHRLHYLYQEGKRTVFKYAVNKYVHITDSSQTTMVLNKIISTG